LHNLCCISSYVALFIPQLRTNGPRSGNINDFWKNAESTEPLDRKIFIDIDAGANILSDLHEHNPIIFDDNAMSSIGNVITG
jgi:hypothetical protein